jgi:epoxyqueuosine reductase
MLHVLDRHTIGRILATPGVSAWGVAANTPALPQAPDLPFAISMLMRIDPIIVNGLRHGPTKDYFEEYRRLNLALDEATDMLVSSITSHGQRAIAVPATREDTDNGGTIHFSHKCAATSAGLGWIGKTALFVSPVFGPAVRLATVFTDLQLPPGEPILSSRCGTCHACVDACPAGCGRDVQWRAGMLLHEIFDANACRHQMTLSPVDAPLCGICIAACPHVLRH